jgi:hypothetical protein
MTREWSLSFVIAPFQKAPLIDIQKNVSEMQPIFILLSKDCKSREQCKTNFPKDKDAEVLLSLGKSHLLSVANRKTLFKFILYFL